MVPIDTLDSRKFCSNTAYLKKSTQFLRILMFIIIVSGFTGCHDKPSHEDAWTNQEVNKVIYEIMKENYLWYDELPERRTLDFETDPETFFYSLLVDKDGKNGNPYSDIIPEGEVFLGKSYMGLGFHYFPQSQKVTFVIPDSPAYIAGMHRGDIIKTINGVKVNKDNITQVLSTCTKETLFTIGRLAKEGEPERILEIKIPGRSLIEDNPVYLDTIYSETSIGKIGYLFFHYEFAKGPDGDTTLYCDQLKQVFARFNQQEVKYMILDLRDNAGGDLSMCQLMCTMLAPREAMGKVFITTQRNALNEDKVYLFDQQLIGTGARLDLQKLIVIVSPNTASASELVIHCLKPYLKDKLIVVGTNTEGKNVGMASLDDLEIPWILVPVIFYCVNAEGSHDYSDGLNPDVYIEEDYSKVLYPYGDRREQLLNAAMKAIAAE